MTKSESTDAQKCSTYRNDVLMTKNLKCEGVAWILTKYVIKCKQGWELISVVIVYFLKSDGSK